MNNRSELTTAKKLTRRNFLRLSGLGAGALVLGGCGPLSSQDGQSTPGTSGGQSVSRAPSAAATGRLREYTFEAAPMEISLDGRTAQTWGYNGGLPGPEIRVTEGDTLRVRVKNSLPEGTTVHWHGLPIINKMDGVPDVTQKPIKPGEDFVYEFVVPVAGTYMYHSHAGLQLDRGLYGPLVVDPKREQLSYDREYTLLLDDWLDGVSGDSPERTFGRLKNGGGMMDGMGGMMGDASQDFGDVDYPFYLVNGRQANDPTTLRARRGERLRLRLANIASDTVFRVALAGHKMTVVQADGLPVEPVEVDAVRLGMGERYDVLVEAGNPGIWQVAAAPEGKKGLARALLRYAEAGGSGAPAAEDRPGELTGRLLSYSDLRKDGGSVLPIGSPDRVHDLALTGGMQGYDWTIDGKSYPEADPLEVKKGELVRFTMQNRTMMWHPMHLHGHSFQVDNGTGRGPFKDTVMVEPMKGLSFDFLADNPGDWFFHCHNVYHQEAGMARVVNYV